MDGGTFTVSNGGVFGSVMGTPIINPPQSAILGMHGIFDRPIALKGQVRQHFLSLYYLAVLLHTNLKKLVVKSLVILIMVNLKLILQS